MLLTPAALTATITMAVLPTAQEPDPEPAATRTTADASAPDDQEERGIPDEKIARAVEDALRRDHGVSAHLVDVETESGIVALSGSVDSLLAKDRAVELATAIKGVRSVVDRVVVHPREALTDEELAADVREALMMDPATDSYELEVSVQEGAVTITGQAQSWAEKHLATEVVRSVAGVESVDDRVQVEFVERPDMEVAQDIRRRLQHDVWVDAGAIVVDVDDGAVTLTGSVGSAAEKRRAVARARLQGVRSVDDSGLNVRWWARDEMERDRQSATMSDEQIRDAVVEALLLDPRVYSFQPDVHVSDGVVTLIGTVDNSRAKRAAELDAENTVGVWRVRNYLRVRTPDTPSDADLDGRITKALERDPYVERHEIDPAVVNQKAYLYGTVDSVFERMQAGLVAASVNGVIEVENRLRVSPEWFTLDEQQLKDEIDDALWWSPFVDADQVRVEIDGDTAILTGTVDSRRERSEAADHVRRAGARRVINRLEIAGHGDDSR